jgi:site-specific recombinase XerD
MDPLGPDLLVRSFERHLDAENRSSRTVTGYLVAVRQADSFLRERGTSLEAATRGDLEAFLGDLLSAQSQHRRHLPQGPQDPLRLAAPSAGSAR